MRVSAIPAWLAGLLLLATVGPPATADPPVAGTAAGVWPLRPTPDVVRRFEPPADPWGAGHRGVDLLGSVGQQVRAALPGRVTWAGPLAGRGVVVVDHGETRTTYEPVTAVVDVGASVGAGDRLGVLDQVGSHCFPLTCLHWGWLRGETYLDPLTLVGAGPVRLLPLGSPSSPAPRWPTSATGVAPWTWRPARTQALGCACW